MLAQHQIYTSIHISQQIWKGYWLFFMILVKFSIQVHKNLRFIFLVKVKCKGSGDGEMY